MGSFSLLPTSVLTQLLTKTALLVTVSNGASLEHAAPGTGNQFDRQEEADVGALGQNEATKQESGDAEGLRPSAQDVDPAKESILSPLAVTGQRPEETAQQLTQQPTPDQGQAEATNPQSSISEPVSDVGVSAELPPTSSEAQPPTAPEPTADVVMSESTTGNIPPVSSDVAPALAGLGGESSSTATAGDAQPPAALDALATTNEAELPANQAEPPAKRQRTDTLSAQQPDRSTSSERPAFADSATIEMTPPQLKFAQNSIKSLKSRPESQAFLAPVDPDALNIPHYRQIVTNPMDLGTVDIKLALTAAAAKGGKPTEKTKQASAWKLDPSNDVYRSVQAWEDDVRLVFANCIRFNGPDHIISQSAKTLEAVFDKQLKSMPVEPPPVPPAPVVSEAEKRARRPSNPVPTIRRSSSDANGRPKREIHPPAPRDLPYADEPQSASSGKKRKSSKALTPRQQAYYAKVNQDELKFCQKVVDECFTKPTLQQVAWPFYDLVSREADFGPAYYAVIKKPICLKQIQERFRQGVYRDKGEFIADMNLLFSNCFTFNEPESDVYKMGQTVETAFQDRMKKMPVPRPLSPEPEDDEDEDDDEEAEIIAEIAQIEQRLAYLRGQQQALRNNKTAAAAKKKAAKAAAAEAAAKKKAAKAAKASSFTEGPSKKSKKKKALQSDGSDDENSVRPVSLEQKEELAAMINDLTDDRLEMAVKIINEDKPQDGMPDDEIELDIDELSPRVLYKLYRHVVRPKKKPGPKPGTAKSVSSSKQSTNKKRKNLDEEQEAARIAALQEQLQSFDRGPQAPGLSAASTVPAPHDSDSSSGEEEDGSDSDY